jgi:valyl-tRNA synthetase
MLSSAAIGSDIILDPKDIETSFAPGRNFANKLWNAGRFILGNLDGPTRPLAGPHQGVVRRDELQLADRWIIARCDAAVRDATRACERFRLNDAVAAAYRFLWDDLADWYIEQVKPRLYGDQPGGDVARAVLARTFDVALRLLHPAMPFVTEALWRRFPGRDGSASISVAAWPGPDDRAADPEALARFGWLQELVRAVRSIRAEYGVQPGQTVRIVLGQPSPLARAALGADRATVLRLAKADRVEVGSGGSTGQAAGHAVLSDGTEVAVPLGELIDIGRECARLAAELARLEGQLGATEAKLANPQFTERAPAAVVAREREKLAAWQEQAAGLRRKRAELGCAG